MTSRTIRIIASVTVIGGLVGTFVVPTWLDASLAVTDAISRNGGEWRVVRLGDEREQRVVVHRKDKWCKCPGLGVATQLTSTAADSTLQLANTLLSAFLDEARREPEPRRCLTVVLEVGEGRFWPWRERPHYVFSLWRTDSGGWKAFQVEAPHGEIGAVRTGFEARWRSTAAAMDRGGPA